MKNNIIVIDCETGGFVAEKNPITQIALLVMEPVNLSEIFRWQTFVKPYDDLEITTGALQASRVEMRDINNGIDKRELLKKLIEIFKKYNCKGKNGKPIVGGQNTEFDLSFLDYLMTTSNQNLYDYISRFHYDTMKMFLHIEAHLKDADKYKNNLTAICERYGVNLIGAHDAMSDTVATSELIRIYINRARNAKIVSSTSEDSELKKQRSGFKFEF